MIFSSSKNRILAVILLTALSVVVNPSIAMDNAKAGSNNSKFGFISGTQDEIQNPMTVFVAGKTNVTFHISEFGRYAVVCKSKPGVALELIDHMSGPIARDGKPGSKDGRLDVFMDRGDYRLDLESLKPEVPVDAELEIHAFTDVSGAFLPEMKTGQVIQKELADFQQASFWIEAAESQDFAIEAIGRNLKDMRLWRNAEWLMETTPHFSEIQSSDGQPMMAARLSTKLDKGGTMLVIYGGESALWANDDGTHPLHIRTGIEHLTNPVRINGIIGLWGCNHYTVPADLDLIRVDLPDIQNFKLEAAFIEEDDCFTDATSLASIDAYSKEPFTQLELQRLQNGKRRITVIGNQNQSYALQIIRKYWEPQFDLKERHWISTVHTGNPIDSIDASGVLIKTPSKKKAEVVDVDAPSIGPDMPWCRRFNLPSSASVYVSILKAGKYSVQYRGVDCRHRIEPFMLTQPSNYKQPQMQSSGYEWALEQGLYQLTIEPVMNATGILEIALVASEDGQFRWDDLLSKSDRINWIPDPAIQFENITGDPQAKYSLLVGRQPGIRVARSIRSYPLILTDPVDIVIEPKSTCSVSCRTEYDGTIDILDELGKSQSFTIDGKDVSEPEAITPGEHEISIRNDDISFLIRCIRFEKIEVEVSESTFDIYEMRRSLDIQTLTIQEPLSFDLEKNQRKTYQLHVEEPGLYILESSGLLATEGSLRTRTEPSLFREAANGTGRNFLIQQYFRQGDYQIRIKTLGSTKGHLGLSFRKADLIDGGELFPGSKAQNELMPANAIIYTIPIYEKGTYHIRCEGMDSTISSPRANQYLRSDWEDRSSRYTETEDDNGGDEYSSEWEGEGEYSDYDGDQEDYSTESYEENENDSETSVDPSRKYFKCRFEDAAGWPVGTPGRIADFDIDLVPGLYRLVIMPEAIPSQHIASVEPVSEVVRSTGHGPFQAEFGGSIQHIWRESESQDRIPDIFVFDLPADAPVTIELTNEMTTRLLADNDVQQSHIWESTPSRPLHVDLKKGTYRLEVISSRKNDRLPYQLQVTSEILLPGVTQTLNAPDSIEVAVGKSGFYSIESIGRADVRARLTDETQRTIAVNDDRPSNWNFLLSQYLDPGRYTLFIEPAGSLAAKTVVQMKQFKEFEYPLFTMPSCLSINPENGMALLPFDLPAGTEVFVSSIYSEENIGVCVERFAADQWKPCYQAEGKNLDLMIPFDREEENEKDSIRLRFLVWSLDQRYSRIMINSDSFQAQKVNEHQAGKGILVSPVINGFSAYALLRFDLERPGAFRLETDGQPQALASDRLGFGAVPVFQNDLYSSTAKTWIICPLPDSTRQYHFKLKRNVMASDQKTVVKIDKNNPRVQYDFQHIHNNPMLITAISKSAISGIAAGNSVDDPVGSVTSMVPVSLNDSITQLMVFPAKDSNVVIWNAKKQNDTSEITLSCYEPKQMRKEKIAVGSSHLIVNPDEAVRFELPDGLKHLDLFMTQYLVAGLARNGKTEKTISSNSSTFTESLICDSEELLIMNTASSPQAMQLNLQMNSLEKEIQSIRSNQLFDITLPVKCNLSIPIEAADNDSELLVRGRYEDCVMQMMDGTVVSGPGFQWNGGSGMLHLKGANGAIVCWMHSQTDEMPVVALLNSESESAQIKPDEWMPLDGSIKSYSMDAGQPVSVQVIFDTASIVLLHSLSENRMELYSEGGQMIEFLPDGKATVVMKSLVRSSMQGHIMVKQLPAIKLDGQSPVSQLMAPGSLQAFSFDIEKEEVIGIGVLSNPDVAEVKLIDAKGTVLQNGVVQMPELKAGSYYLTIEIPDHRPPAAVSVALNRKSHSVDPVPEAEKQKYILPAGVKP